MYSCNYQITLSKSVFGMVANVDTQIPVELNDQFIPTIISLLNQQKEKQNYCGILICLTCLSSLCLYRYLHLFLLFIGSLCEKVCRDEVIDLLSEIAYQNGNSIQIMQQISLILMYCGGIESCIPKIIESTLLLKLRSFVYLIIKDSSNQSIENCVYPFISIIHHLCMQGIHFSFFYLFD